MANRRPSKGATTKTGQYSLASKFPGYQARADVTTIPSTTLVSPSQNVVLGTSGRVALVKGYQLDGAGSSTADSGILSHFDFKNFKSDLRNMRAGFLTTAGNDGKLQYRYQTGTNVSWINLKTALTTVRLSFCEFWDTQELKKLLMWVDGSNVINQWNGATTTFASATAPSSTVVQTITATPVAGGTNYQVGDVLTLNTGTGARVRVTAVNGVTPFNATTVTLIDVGTGGYPVGTVTTTNTTGAGSGATIAITALQTASTITKQGTNTWAQDGFFQTRSMSIVVNGTTQDTYAYQTGFDTKTLTGVTPDPTLAAYSAGAIIHQAPTQNALASMTGILPTFGPTVIGAGRSNQLYLGSATSNSLYISRVNSSVDFSFSSPRLVGEGNLIPLDAPPTKFIPLENRNDQNAYDLYISEGTDTWAVIRSTLSADLTSEKQEHIRLNVSPLQAAKSGRLVSKMKNHIIFVGCDNVANFFGYTSFQNVPELVDFSHTIIDDQSSYDFTDGSIYYANNYIYEAIPKAGLVRIFNMTDQSQEQTSSIRGIEDVDADQPWFWEAPVTYPISGFYRDPAGNLCGHGYNASESYTLFTGGRFNGQDITANATFAFDAHGDRTQSKGSDELYVEGYIKQNTILNATIAGDLDAFQTTQTKPIDGSDNTIVAYGSGAHSIGKNNLGSQPLGGAQTSTSTLPAWFHVIKTYNEVQSYLEQVSFSSKGVDLDWSLITFGTNAQMTTEGNNQIRQ